MKLWDVLRDDREIAYVWADSLAKAQKQADSLCGKGQWDTVRAAVNLQGKSIGRAS